MLYYIHKLINSCIMWKAFIRGFRETCERSTEKAITTVVDYCAHNADISDNDAQQTKEQETNNNSSNNQDDERQNESNNCQINLHKILEAVGLSTMLCLGTYASYPHCWRKHTHSLTCDMAKTEKEKKKGTWKLLQLVLGTAIAQPLTNKTADPDQKDDTESTSEEAEDANPELEINDVVEEAKKDMQRISGRLDNILGVLCIKGGFAFDAFRSFEFAWQMGDINACFNLGLCYEQGIGTTKNQVLAGQYYQKASSLGHAGAMYNLAIYYSQGRGGLPVDREKAQDLLSHAARSGLEEAAHVLELECWPELCEADSQLADSTSTSSRDTSDKELDLEDLPELSDRVSHLTVTSAGDWSGSEITDAAADLRDTVSQLTEPLLQPPSV